MVTVIKFGSDKEWIETREGEINLGVFDKK